jgi:hypothetical protein
VQSGELPVLPLSIAGAVSMTHLPDTESFLSGDEWFIYKFDKQQAGLSGGCGYASLDFGGCMTGVYASCELMLAVVDWATASTAI